MQTMSQYVESSVHQFGCCHDISYTHAIPVLPHSSATLVKVMIVFVTATADVAMQQHGLTPGSFQPLSTGDALQAGQTVNGHAAQD